MRQNASGLFDPSGKTAAHAHDGDRVVFGLPIRFVSSPCLGQGQSGFLQRRQIRLAAPVPLCGSTHHSSPARFEMRDFAQDVVLEFLFGKPGYIGQIASRTTRFTEQSQALALLPAKNATANSIVG